MEGDEQLLTEVDLGLFSNFSETTLHCLMFHPLQRGRRVIKILRRSQNLSQEALAKLSKIPRTTITHMESGGGNPSLSNVIGVAKALGVTIDELLSPPYNPVELISKKDVPLISRSSGKVKIYKILPTPLKGFEIDRVVIEPGYRMKGAPHMKGTKEYLCCLRGGGKLFTEGDAFEIHPGDVLIFPGDQAHSYLNTGSKQFEFISVVYRFYS